MPSRKEVPEFSGLLAWEAHVALQQLPVRAVCGVSASRLAAHLLEARGERLAAAMGELLGAFEHWLREWLL